MPAECREDYCHLPPWGKRKTCKKHVLQHRKERQEARSRLKNDPNTFAAYRAMTRKHNKTYREKLKKLAGYPSAKLQACRKCGKQGHNSRSCPQVKGPFPLTIYDFQVSPPKMKEVPETAGLDYEPEKIPRVALLNALGLQDPCRRCTHKRFLHEEGVCFGLVGCKCKTFKEQKKRR